MMLIQLWMPFKMGKLSLPTTSKLLPPTETITSRATQSSQQKSWCRRWCIRCPCLGCTKSWPAVNSMRVHSFAQFWSKLKTKLSRRTTMAVATFCKSGRLKELWFLRNLSVSPFQTGTSPMMCYFSSKRSTRLRSGWSSSMKASHPSYTSSSCQSSIWIRKLIASMTKNWETTSFQRSKMLK